MQENSNKAIVINTIVLYGRLLITMICGLFSTRFALQALGPIDFGFYSVVASIIVFAGLINTSMLAACNRFIATAVGEGDLSKINKTFNATFIIHIAIAIVTLLIIAPIGHYYINHYVNYDGSLSVAHKIFTISICATAVSFLWVPYNAILMARERFIFFCGVDVIFSLLKLALSYYLLFYSGDTLIAYSIIMAFTTAIPGFVFLGYCRRFFKDYVRLSFVNDFQLFRSILSFSVWTGYGAFVQIGQAQCAALLVNAFFNTLMNTALSVTNYLKSAVVMMTDNLTKSISPQITKSYAAGNRERCINLMILISKVSFFSALVIATPFFIHTEYIITLWLGQVPKFAVLFTRIIMATVVVSTFNKGISEYVFAVGNIKVYQIFINTLLFLSVVVGYVVLKRGAEAYILLYVFLGFELLAVFARQIIIHKVYNFDNFLLWKGSYLPSLIILTLSLPLYYLKNVYHPILNILLFAAIQCVYFIFIGLTITERKKVFFTIKSKLKTLK